MKQKAFLGTIMTMVMSMMIMMAGWQAAVRGRLTLRQWSTLSRMLMLVQCVHCLVIRASVLLVRVISVAAKQSSVDKQETYCLIMVILDMSKRIGLGFGSVSLV